MAVMRRSGVPGSRRQLWNTGILFSLVDGRLGLLLPREFAVSMVH